MESPVSSNNNPKPGSLPSANGTAHSEVPASDEAPPEVVEEPAGLWAKRNLVNILIGVALVGLVFWKLNPVDVGLAAAGLTLIIFIHELGHFAAAKLCKVRVETFSIGFGPAIPGCHFQYGETYYKLAVVPLGGYVKMLGQEDGVIDGEPDDDPRSYKNQTVPERMLIISAGVIMNVLLGGLLFVIVYMHGLEEKPGEIAYMEPGGAAWRQGIHSGTKIESLGGRSEPWFDDIRPTVWATQQGEKLPITLSYKGVSKEYQIEPLAEEGAPFPVLGVAPPESLKLTQSRRNDNPPYRVGSPAAKASGPGGEGFRSGDRIVAMSDPGMADHKVTDLPADRGIYEYYRRLALLAGKPITFQVVRNNSSEALRDTITVGPAYRREVGLRMRMGAIVAVRTGSAAERAGLITKSTGIAGDRIVEVEIMDEGKPVIYSAGAPSANKRPLDPLRLPQQLNHWADRTPGTKMVKLTVLREADHAEKRETLSLSWDEVSRFDLTTFTGSSNTPIAVNGLGLAYQVQAVVDAVAEKSPAAEAGLQAGDTIEAVRFKMREHDGTEISSGWQDIKPHQWAAADNILQQSALVEYEVRVNRNGQAVEPVKLTVESDPTLPVDERGIELGLELRIQQAESIGEALGMGFHRTMRSIRGIYLNLYAMVFGRMSAMQTLSGPITLARASYMLAGESIWRLLLLLALISINLAVVNFLPIPVLDGGHMVFLAYEGLRGKPAPERVQVWLTIVGLFCIGCLMLFVIGLDIYRLALMWISRW